MKIATSLRIVASFLIFGVIFQIVDQVYIMSNPDESENGVIKMGLLVISIGVVVGLYGMASIIDRLDGSLAGT